MVGQIGSLMQQVRNGGDATRFIVLAGVLFGSETVAESRKEPMPEEDLSEEPAGDSGAHNGGPCTPHTLIL